MLYPPPLKSLALKYLEQLLRGTFFVRHYTLIYVNYSENDVSTRDIITIIFDVYHAHKYVMVIVAVLN